MTSEQRLARALQEHWNEILEDYSERVSRGQDKLTVRDVAISYLLGLRGIRSDIKFQNFLTNALQDPKYKFSGENAQVINQLIDNMKQKGLNKKHAMIQLLEQKLPVSQRVSAASTINVKARYQMLQIKEELDKNPELKRLVADHSLSYALEHDPGHLFSVMSTVNPGVKHEASMNELRANCMDKHINTILLKQ